MRHATIATLMVVCATVTALIIGELLLHVYGSGRSSQESMDPGLIRYHSRYGWALSPGWEGTHSHEEYEVTYNVDLRGFRQAQAEPGRAQQLNIIVGDSFTFGLGVGNGETYTARLNEQIPGQFFINAAVPGYSPEQVLLRAEDLTRIYSAGTLIFVIYLGNDLIDLGLPFPVQAEFAKPYASLQSGSWQLLNQPVPAKVKPEELRARTLGSYIVEPGSQSWLAGRRLGQLIMENGLVPNPVRINRQQVDNAMQLLRGVLTRVDQLKADRTVVLLLPGSGPVNRPRSLAATYQGLVDQHITAMADEYGFEILSLMAPLKSMGNDLYYPLDGHLTAAGHKAVAGLLHDRLIAASASGKAE